MTFARSLPLDISVSPPISVGLLRAGNVPDKARQYVTAGALPSRSGRRLHCSLLPWTRTALPRAEPVSLVIGSSSRFSLLHFHENFDGATAHSGEEGENRIVFAVQMTAEAGNVLSELAACGTLAGHTEDRVRGTLAFGEVGVDGDVTGNLAEFLDARLLRNSIVACLSGKLVTLPAWWYRRLRNLVCLQTAMRYHPSTTGRPTNSSARSEDRAGAPPAAKRVRPGR